MLTKKQMCDSIIRMFGFEHEITIRFFLLVEWGFTRTELYTAYKEAEKIFQEM